MVGTVVEKSFFCQLETAVDAHHIKPQPKRNEMNILISAHLLLLHILVTSLLIANTTGEDGTQASLNQIQCTICLDGSPVSSPNTIIPVDHFQGFSDSSMTCGELDELSSYLSLDSEDCYHLQYFGYWCGCSTRNVEPAGSSGGCELCPDGRIPQPQNSFFTVEEFPYELSAEDGDWLPTEQNLLCGYYAFETYEFLPPDSENCFHDQLRREVCGCSRSPHLSGLMWSRIASSILSILVRHYNCDAQTIDCTRQVEFTTCLFFSFKIFQGSSYIIYIVLRDPNRRHRTYEQLVIGISTCDLVGSFAYVLSHLLLPATSSIPGALGNMTTCSIQAGMLQFSLCSLAFNLLLAIYFWLSVAKRWMESDMKKYRAKVFAAVVVLYLGMAVGTIPFYRVSFYTCEPPSRILFGSWQPVIWFMFVPIGACLLGMLWATLALFRAVYKIEKSSAQWRMVEATDSLTVTVFWRCFWYLLASIVPWSLYLAQFHVEFKQATYGYWIVLELTIPIQGFLNALVFYQRTSTSKSSRTSSTAANQSRLVGSKKMVLHPLSKGQSSEAKSSVPSADFTWNGSGGVQNE